jgi:hypothetical protein
MSIPIGTPPGVHTGAYDSTGRTSGPDRPAPTNAFARVYELEEARRRREVPIMPMAGDRIPDEVWDEVDAAARLFDRLHAEGRRVVFDTDRLSGKVVASLLDADGGSQAMPLTEAVDPAAGRPAATAPPALGGGTPPSLLPAGGLRAVYGGGAPAFGQASSSGGQA